MVERRELFARLTGSIRNWLHPLARAEKIGRRANSTAGLAGRRWCFSFAGHVVGRRGRRRTFCSAPVDRGNAGERGDLLLGNSFAAIARGAADPVHSYDSDSANSLQQDRFPFTA